ncbi:MAG: CPBP family glutamic-type intramembrane protease [Thermoguttaceae bacterium]|nr:CPBP family glutamic-type intramembrane protease [Thermoguttaceae bacterium]
MSESHPETSLSETSSTDSTPSAAASSESAVDSAMHVTPSVGPSISSEPAASHGKTSNESSAEAGLPPAPHFWTRNRWLIPVLPLAVYLLCGWVEPSRTPPAVGSWMATWAIPFDYYPAYYFFRMTLTLLALLLVIPGIRSHLAGDWQPFRWHGVSLLLGVFGAVVWVGLCQIPWNTGCVQMATWIGLGDGAHWLVGSAARVGFNPWSDLDATPGALSLATFLAVRFAGLAVIVPFAEELFLRGFLLRFVQREKWWTVPVGALTRLAIVTLIVYAVVTHPSEWVAAMVWFSAVTWWTARTQNLWYAVQVHMTTNLCLGLWVLWSRQWWLW